MTPIEFSTPAEKLNDGKAEGLNQTLFDTEKTSPLDFLAAVREFALAHPAAEHPYFHALADNKIAVPMASALLNYATEYSAYSRHFVRMVEMIQAKLDVGSEAYTAVDINRREECGEYDDEMLASMAEEGIEAEWVQGVHHKDLFIRYKQALANEAGVTMPELAPADGPGTKLSKTVIELLEKSPAAVAMAVLAYQNELIAPRMNTFTFKAIQKFTQLSPRDSSFFPLHIGCDDGHFEGLERAIASVGLDTETRYQLFETVRAALDVRAELFATLLEQHTRKP